jgi:hypothetical protein
MLHPERLCYHTRQIPIGDEKDRPYVNLVGNPKRRLPANQEHRTAAERRADEVIGGC